MRCAQCKHDKNEELFFRNGKTFKTCNACCEKRVAWNATAKSKLRHEKATGKRIKTRKWPKEELLGKDRKFLLQLRTPL